MSLHNTPVLVSCCLPTHWIPLWSIHSHSFNITQKTACFTQKHTQNIPGHIQLCVTRYIWSLLLKRKQPVPMQTPSHDTEDTREAESCRSSRFREIQHHTSTLYICCPHHTHSHTHQSRTLTIMVLITKQGEPATGGGAVTCRRTESLCCYIKLASVSTDRNRLTVNRLTAWTHSHSSAHTSHTHHLFIIHVSEWWSCFYQRLLLWPVRAGRHLWARVSRWNPECKAAFFMV